MAVSVGLSSGDSGDVSCAATALFVSLVFHF